MCSKEVKVDHVNPPVWGCDCKAKGATIFASVEGHAHGKGGVNASTIVSNLSDFSMLVLKNAILMLAAHEFFAQGKDKLFAEDLRIKDEPTGREFSFTITAKELKQ